MKKFLALSLCALMVLAMAVVAFAADENAFEYNFDDDDEGDFIAVDNSIKFYPKMGTVEVVTKDGSKCAKISQIDFIDDNANADSYLDLVAGGVSTYGVDPAFVLEYDVFFEECGEGMQWQICCSRETPASGTKFQQVGYFKGDKNIYVTGIEGVAGTFEWNKWIHVAVAMDATNDVFSLYIDGKCLAKDIDFNIDDTSATESERIRTAFGKIAYGSNAVGYLDNIVIYNASVPRGLENAAVETAAPVTEAPATAAPETTAAAVTAAPAPAAPAKPAAQTADIAVVIAAVAAIAGSAVIVSKKRH